jgi:hypothetical protein
LDLGASFASNAVYFGDFHVAERPDFEPVSKLITVGLRFDGNGIATLDELSNQSKDGATLVQDFGLSRSNILQARDWEFVTGNTVRINPSLLNTDALYSLTYTALSAHPSSKVVEKLEVRTATSTILLASATYAEFKRNVPLNLSRYVQLRLTISGMTTVDDAKIMSLCIKKLSTLPNSTPVIT